MKAMKNIVCPISEEKVNERITRINALLTVLITVAGVFFNSALFFCFFNGRFLYSGIY